MGIDYLQKTININLSSSDLDEIFKAMDFDNSGQIDYS